MRQSIRNIVGIFIITFMLIFAGLGGKGEATTNIDLVTTGDTYVTSVNPNNNYGTTTSLFADNSPDVKSIVGFTVSGLGGAAITKATLSVYALSANTGGLSLAQFNDADWSETGETYSLLDTAAIGPILSTTKPVTTGQWVSFDVTSQIQYEGAYSFLLLPVNGTNTKFASREAGPTTAPKLALETAIPSPTPTPTPTPSPSPTPSLTPTPTPVPSPTPTPIDTSSDPVVSAAGDIACDPGNSNFKGGLGIGPNCRQSYTANDLAGSTAVLLLGDNQYYCGGLSAYQQSYDLSWGKYKNITHPSIGNHEYLTSGGTGCDSSNINGAGYFNYFGTAAGEIGKAYYSYDVGSWHMIVLNSNCSSAGGCSSTSSQGKWLANDLATHSNMCTLAYWHIPLWSSGGRASSNTASLMKQLYNANADVVLTGHDHIYERFAPQNSSGVADPARGIRAFVVGTGGSNHTSLANVAANSEVRNADTFGVLKMTLHSNSYDWSFAPSAVAGNGTFTDSGSGTCH